MHATSAFRKTVETFVAGAKTLPQRYFVSPEVFAEEQAQIFARQWICVGHQSQVSQAGDYFVQLVAGESLIVVRDKGGRFTDFTMSAVIGGRGCARRRADTSQPFSVLITPGRMGWVVA